MSIVIGFLLLKLYYQPFLCNKRLEALLSGLASFPFTKALKPYQSLQQTEPCIHHYSFSYLLISFESSKHHQMKTRSIERVFHLVIFFRMQNSGSVDVQKTSMEVHFLRRSVGPKPSAPCGRNSEVERRESQGASTTRLCELPGRNKAKNERFESVLSTH